MNTGTDPIHQNMSEFFLIEEKCVHINDLRFSFTRRHFLSAKCVMWLCRVTLMMVTFTVPSVGLLNRPSLTDSPTNFKQHMSRKISEPPQTSVGFIWVILYSDRLFPQVQSLNFPPLPRYSTVRPAGFFTTPAERGSTKDLHFLWASLLFQIPSPPAAFPNTSTLPNIFLMSILIMKCLQICTCAFPSANQKCCCSSQCKLVCLSLIILKSSPMLKADWIINQI